MKESLLDLLMDPVHRTPLKLEEAQREGQEIVSGLLCSDEGTTYAIQQSIPRFVTLKDAGQQQTQSAFAFKWSKRETYETPAFNDIYSTWLYQKYGFDSLDNQTAYFASRKRILDLGCGSGSASLPWLSSQAWTGKALWVGVDISQAIDIARDRLHSFANTHFVQGDALELPFFDETFDTIFSEGVLHHTPSTRAAILAATRVLEIGGAFHFYVYRRKAPLREFSDDYVREAICDLSDEAAWEEMRSLTELGKALSDLQAQVEVPDVPVLGIKAGSYDVQRLIYWNFAKLFWNDSLSFEANVHVNFDWYRPQYSHRQTEAEVQAWCEEAGLSITRFHQQDSGFTVTAMRIR
jgi:arsenite methyltransferase